MKILDNDGVGSSVIDYCIENSIEVIQEKIDKNSLKQYIEDNKIDCVIIRSATKMTSDILSAKGLKYVIRAGVGLDNVNLNAAEEYGVEVFNTPMAANIAVAELTLGLMLSGYRNIHQGFGMSDDDFKKAKKIKGMELYGKTLGIIGAGRIGKRVGELASVFGMDVIYYDKYQDEYKNNFDKLLSDSDIITLHVPYTGEYIISEDEIDKMKNGVSIVNSGRGGLINESYVIKNIGKFSFIGLDTYENEPNVNPFFLLQKNVVCTAHIGSQTNECQERISKEIIDRINQLN